MACPGALVVRLVSFALSLSLRDPLPLTGLVIKNIVELKLFFLSERKVKCTQLGLTIFIDPSSEEREHSVLLEEEKK